MASSGRQLIYFLSAILCSFSGFATDFSAENQSLTQAPYQIPEQSIERVARSQHKHHASPRLSEAQLQAIEQYIERLTIEFPHVGMAIGIDHAGEQTTWYKGQADREHGHDFHSESLFRYASITKMFTAVAVLKAEEEGRLKLTDRVAAHTDLWPKESPVIIKDVLAHLSGISGYKNCAHECFHKNHHNTKAAIDIFKHWELVAPAGEKYTYSSYGFNLLAGMLESIYQKSFQEILEEKIFDPANMQHTFVEFERSRTKNWVQGYRYAGRIKKSRQVDISSRFGGGGTRGNLSDLLQFGRALLNDRLLKEHQRRYIAQSRFTNHGRRVDYAHGFAVFPYAGTWLIGHAGGQPETSTLLLIAPEHDLVIALASNIEGDAQKLKIASRKIIDIVSGRPASYWSKTGHTPKMWFKANVYQRLKSYGHAYRYLNGWLGGGLIPKAAASTMNQQHVVHPCEYADPILKGLQLSSGHPKSHAGALKNSIGVSNAIPFCGASGYDFGLAKLDAVPISNLVDPYLDSCRTVLNAARSASHSTQFRYQIHQPCIRDARRLFDTNSEDAIEMLIEALDYNPMSYPLIKEIIALRFFDTPTGNISEAEIDFFKTYLRNTPERPEVYTDKEIASYKYRFGRKKRSRFDALKQFFNTVDDTGLISENTR